MPIAHDARFAGACLLALLAHLDADRPEAPGVPLYLVVEHASPLPTQSEGHRSVALPHAAVPAGTEATFVYKQTEARAIRSHIPGAHIIDPKAWKDSPVAPPRLVFVDPVFAKGVGAGRHTVKLGGREVVRLAHAFKPGTDLACLYAVHAAGLTTRVAFGYSDMAPASLLANMRAALERSRAVLRGGERSVSRVCLQTPGSTPIEVVGPTARELASAGLLEGQSGIEGASGDAGGLAEAWGAERLVVRRH